MRSFTTRIIILVSAILIAAIVSVQVYWLSKTYSFEENEFTTSVLKTIRGVYEDIPLLYDNSLSLDSLAEKYHKSGFIFQVHNLPQRDSLLFYLAAELEDFRIFTDCSVALYDNTTGKYVYESYLSADANKKNEDRVQPLQVLKRPYNYVQLYFPNRGRYIISQMKSWIYASLLLLLLLTGFAFSLYYFYKQKFLVEVQRDFINNVTHEFSTPLSVMEIATAGMQKTTVLTQPEKIIKYTTSIRHQLDYLTSHISNLVKSAVADNYLFKLSRKEIAPNELLKKAVTQLEPLLEKSNGVVEWNLEKNNLCIQADEDHLYLAFFNIISNAIKYADNPRILIMTSCAGKIYRIQISDNGPGIDPNQQTKVFKKFYRVPQGNLHSVKGLGLGLYFTHKVIHGHSGRIYIKSKRGEGTEFIIELPLK